jgi:hypothetical protein
MAQSKKTEAATVARRTRGPSIAYSTPDGRPTIYGVKKTIWSHRGKVKASGVRGLETGEIQKSAALAILEAAEAKKAKGREAPAPFQAKVQRGVLVLSA